MKADATLPNGEAISVDGFHTVDEERLRAFPDETVLELWRNGMLMLIQMHLVSIVNIRHLVNRKAARVDRRRRRRPSMTGTIFERTLATADIEATFADAQVVVAMLAFEAALAEAEAAEGLIPAKRGRGDRRRLPRRAVRHRVDRRRGAARRRAGDSAGAAAARPGRRAPRPRPRPSSIAAAPART